MRNADSSTMLLVKLRDIPKPQRRLLCLRLYREVLQPAFPLTAELEDPETWLDLMSRNPPPPAPRLHVIAATDEDRVPIGGLVCEYYRESRAGLITYIAVAPDRRRSGVGRQLMEAALKVLGRDADTEDSPVFAEIEDPDRAPSEAAEAGIDLRARLQTLRKLGFAVTQLPYVQPSLAVGKPQVNWLRLAVHRASMPADAEYIPASRIRLFLDEFYRSLHADPRTNESFAAMAMWLDRHPKVALLPLDPP